MDIWDGRTWLPASQALDSDTGTVTWAFDAAHPFFAPTNGWHDDDTKTDAFWGPSVHWNVFLGQYVMLLQRARNTDYDNEGIYVSFSPRLDDPAVWSAPVRDRKSTRLNSSH